MTLRLCLAGLALLPALACAPAPASPPRCPDPMVAPAPQPHVDADGQDRHGHGHGHGHAHAHDHEGGPLVRRFEEADAWANRFEGPERDAYQKPEAVVKAMGLREGMRVADIGAGTGYFLPHLSPAVGPGGRVEAVDIEPAMVRHMIARVARDGLRNVWPRLGAVDDPLLAPETFDRILIVNTWHHIPERAAYAKKLFDALVPGGQVWIVDFELDSERGPAKDHKVAPEQATADLEAGGLTVRVDHDLLPDQYVAIGERP